MRITKNYVECRDPVAHRSKRIVRKYIDKKETDDWEKMYGLIMKKNVFLVWENNKHFLRPYRVSLKDFSALKKNGII